MAEYIDRNKIPWAKVDNPNGIFWERVVFESTINNIPPADVIERSKIDNAIKEMNSMPLGLVMNCDEMRDYCVEILKRNIGE